jgi:hypothetical protein
MDTNERERRQTRRLVPQSGMRYMAVANSRLAVSSSILVSSMPGEVGRAGTVRACSFFAGMNGNPMGGFLFSHVPCFEGEMS